MESHHQAQIYSRGLGKESLSIVMESSPRDLRPVGFRQALGSLRELQGQDLNLSYLETAAVMARRVPHARVVLISWQGTFNSHLSQRGGGDVFFFHRVTKNRCCG